MLFFNDLKFDIPGKTETYFIFDYILVNMTDYMTIATQ